MASLILPVVWLFLLVLFLAVHLGARLVLLVLHWLQLAGEMASRTFIRPAPRGNADDVLPKVAEILSFFNTVTVPAIRAELPIPPALIAEKFRNQETQLVAALCNALPHAREQTLLIGKNLIEQGVSGTRHALFAANLAAIAAKAKRAADRATHGLDAFQAACLATREPMTNAELEAKWREEKTKALHCYIDELITLVDTPEAKACSERIEEVCAAVWDVISEHNKAKQKARKAEEEAFLWVRASTILSPLTFDPYL